MLTRVRPNLRNNDGAAVALDALGLVLTTRMHERVIYAETFAHGKTALRNRPQRRGGPRGERAVGRSQGKVRKQEFMKERIL